MESPETRIIPSEDMNTVQLNISGEKFPEVILELCGNCNWSLQYFNKKGIIRVLIVEKQYPSFL
jgi:hypothetical protein